MTQALFSAKNLPGFKYIICNDSKKTCWLIGSRSSQPLENEKNEKNENENISKTAPQAGQKPPHKQDQKPAPKQDQKPAQKTQKTQKSFQKTDHSSDISGSKLSSGLNKKFSDLPRPFQEQLFQNFQQHLSQKNPGEKSAENEEEATKIREDAVTVNNPENTSENSIDTVKNNSIRDYSFNIIPSLDPVSEVRLIWPEIISRLPEKYNYAEKWLKRACFQLEGNQLSIQLESKLACKRLDCERVINLITNLINKFLNKEIEIKLVNGGRGSGNDGENDLSYAENGGIEENQPGLEDNKDENLEIEKENIAEEDAENTLIKNNNNAARENKNKKTYKYHQRKKQKRQKRLVFGRVIADSKKPYALNNLPEDGSAVVEGEVFKVDQRRIRNGRLLKLIAITDNTDSLLLKIFCQSEADLSCSIKPCDYLKARGQLKYDRYSRETVMLVDDLMRLPARVRQDTASEKRVELHLHTRMSNMDAVIAVEEAIQRAARWGHRSIAITDHGGVQAFPDAYQAGQQHDIKVIFGLEAYLVDDGDAIVVSPGERSLEESKYVVFDFETTGLEASQERIIEIGAVKVSDGQIQESFSSLVNPGRQISRKITRLTGIKNSDTKNAPAISEVLPSFLDFIGDAVLVAHNIDFDYGFLRAECRRTGLETPRLPLLDTVSLSRALLPELGSHKLNRVAKALDISLDNHHRAEDDAAATAEILLKLLEKFRQEGQNIKNDQSKKENSERQPDNEKNLTGLAELNKLTGRIDWKKKRYSHAVLLAKNKAGLKDLYYLVSRSHLNNFYKKPRILKSELKKHRSDLLVGSACEAGDLFKALMQDKSREEIREIARFYDYLEIQPAANNEFMVPERFDSLNDIRDINQQIYQLGRRFNKPVVATSDAHFLDPEDNIYREILQTGQKFDDADQQPPLYFKTTDEMLKEFSYLGEEAAREVVIENPGTIDAEIEKMPPMPDGLFTPEIEGADDKVREMTFTEARRLYGEDLPPQVEDRLEKELQAIINNGFAVIYLISHKLVKQSLEDGYLVGSRGSVGSSLVARMCEITEVNPLPPHYRCSASDCSYSYFFITGADNLEIKNPAIDKPEINSPVAENTDSKEPGTTINSDGATINTDDNTTNGTSKNPDASLNTNTSIQAGTGADLPDARCPHCGARLIKDGFDIPFEVFMGFDGNKVPDIDLNFSGEYQSKIHSVTEDYFGRDYVFRAGTISTIADRTAYGFVKNYLQEKGLDKRGTEINRLVQGCTGVKRTTGQHPGGLMVVPRDRDIHDFTPIQHPANDQSTDVRTTHFDYHAISGRILKLDLLGHDDPTSIRMLQDMTGVDPLSIELDHPETMQLFSGVEPLNLESNDLDLKVGTLGIPEFGTSFVRQMLTETRPTTFAELVRISGLSHGTDVWLNNARDLIQDGVAELKEVISVRDDIMNYLNQQGLDPADSFSIMENVRKGKGLTPEEEKKMRAVGVPAWYVDSCKKIKYMFPKAHAAAYVMMAFRIAYFKVRHPEEFYTTYFTIKASDFDAEIVSQGYQYVLDYYQELESRSSELTAKDKNLMTVLEIVIEAMARGINFLPVDLYRSSISEFQLTEEGLLPPLISLTGLGNAAAESLVTARQESKFSSIEDLQNRTSLSTTVIEVMKEHGSLEDLPERDQLSLFAE